MRHTEQAFFLFIAKAFDKALVQICQAKNLLLR
jgi:hypothetical protein